MSCCVESKRAASCNLCSEEPLLLKPFERLSSFNLSRTLTMCCIFCSERYLVLCLSETFSRLVFAKCLQSACLNFWHCRSFSVLVYAPKSLGCSNLMKGLIPSIWVKHLRCVAEFVFWRISVASFFWNV